MGFESPDLTHRENFEAKQAIKSMVRFTLGEFETKVSELEKSDSGKSSDRYLGMTDGALWDLHVVVGDLRAQVVRLERQFPALDEKIKKALDDIYKKTTVLIKSKEEMKFMGEAAKKGKEFTVDEELANTLGNEMHDVRESIKELKGIFSLNLEASGMKK